jgi:hypothetical protein
LKPTPRLFRTRLPQTHLLSAAMSAAMLCSPSAFAADAFTAGVLSCAAESDREHRLNCYDRAVASFTARLSDGRRDSAAAEAPPAAAALPETASPPTPGAAKASSPSAARHVSARIVSIDNFPDYVVVHLDNQQIWKQVAESPGGPALRTGDTVAIDKQVGSYWLSGSRGEPVQVKLQTPKP